MDVVRLLAHRQYGFNRRPICRPVSLYQPTYMTLSNFDSLLPHSYYHFVNFDGGSDSPLTAITGHDDEILLANDVGDIGLMAVSGGRYIPKFQFHGHDSAIFDVKYRPEYRHQGVTAAGDRSIMVWDLNRPSMPLRSFFPAHNGSVKSLSFQSANVFVSGGRDGALKLWDLRTACAIKHGPVLVIPDPHIHVLPSLKSPHHRNGSMFRTARSRRQNPIIWSAESINYHPSNVVTCVQFRPDNENYFYSSGVADNALKVWDIRHCRRQYQCNITPTATRIHSTKNVATDSCQHHGYSSFVVDFDSEKGPVIYASSTNGKIYVFSGQTVYPSLALAGRYSNSQTKISMFGKHYLVSGSANARVHIWNCQFEKQFINENDDQFSIENRMPIYEFSYDNMAYTGMNDGISLVYCDFLRQSIYCNADPNTLWRWTFDSDKKANTTGGEYPIGRRYAGGEENRHPGAVQIRLKRTSFEAINSNNKRPSMSGGPLSSITNWIQSETKKFKPNNPPDISGKDDTPNDENRYNAVGTAAMTFKSKSTTHKTNGKAATTTIGRKKRDLRRNLFNDNRKIKEFFPAV